MKKINEPYYLDEADIIHHIASVFHIIPAGGIPELPYEYMFCKLSKTLEEFEVVFNREFSKCKFSDKSLFLKIEIEEYEKRENEIMQFDPKGFSEEIQLIHDYLNFLKGKAKNQFEAEADKPEGIALQNPDSIDSILRIIFKKESDKDSVNLTKPLNLLKENLKGQTHNLSEYRNNYVYNGEIKGLEKNVKMLWGVKGEKLHRKTVKAVFEEYVTISPGSAYTIGKKINFNNHI